MKNLSCLLAVLVLSGCIYAGDNDFFSPRKDFFTAINGYLIEWASSEPKLAKTEIVEENNFKLNESMTAFRGYTVLNSKIYHKDTYAEMLLRPNHDGVMHSVSVPMEFSANKNYDVRGFVTIDGADYRLIDSGLKGFYILIDRDGAFYQKIGQAKGNYLVLLDTKYYITPDDLRMVEVVNTNSTQTKPRKGFDLKFDGVNANRIWFTYLDYSNDKDNKGFFENISFPLNAGVIEINGIGFRVLRADNDRLDYIILKNKN